MAKTIVYHLVAPLDKTIGAHEVRRRQDYLQAHAGPDVAVIVKCPPSGYPSIESERDVVTVSPHLVSGLAQAERDGASAGIVGCFADPALDAVREAVSIPVVGPGQASVALAIQLGDRFSILSPLDRSAKRMMPRLRSQALGARLASVRGVGVSVNDLARGETGAWEKIVATGRRCIDEDGADVLIMGCMSMAFMGIEGKLSSCLDVPVVSPVLAALKSAETMVALGLAPSKTVWPTPTHANLIG